jgi:peptide/nickel transport system substrate-binding protein
MKKSTFVLFLVLIPLVFAQMAGAAPQGTLRVALSTFPNALYTALSDERNAHNASWQLYDSLVWVNDDGKVEPALAETWTVSEDGRTYTFKLRKGVVFHNGEPFTADSVVFTWNLMKQDKVKWSEKFNFVKDVKKIDDHTVAISTEKPSPLLIRVIATFWGVIPPKYYNEKGQQGFLNHPVGTGPFRFVEWKKGDRLIYEANPTYWDKEKYPKVKNLIFRPIPESATRLAAIKTGEVDIVGRLSAEEAAQLKGQASVKLITYPKDRIFYITFNNLTTGKGKPTMDPRVRQAMNYAVDVDAIIDALFNGQARAATGLVMSGNFGYDKAAKAFGYDPAKAKALLKEAGYPNGFKMKMAGPTGAYTNFEQVLEAIQGYLADVGIETDLTLMESGKYWDLEAKKQLPPLFGDSWSETNGESLERLKGALGGTDASYSSWEDPKIKKYLADIGSTVNDAKREQLYIDLQRYMIENPPFIYLYEPMAFEAINPKVKGYVPRPAEDYYLKTVSVE